MKYGIVTFLLLFSFALQAQVGNYSYVEDRKFIDIETLYGYEFKPFKVEYMDGDGGRIAAGKHSFAYFNDKLYVVQGEKKSVFWVNNAEPTKYGYILKTMNARDATMQGHLKIILNQYAEAETLIFRKTKSDDEIIYLLPSTMEDKNKKKQEAGYFTDRHEVKYEEDKDLWGTKVFPFIKVQENQYRFQMADSTWFEFVETYDVIDKRKAPKAEKAEKKSKGKSKGKKKKGDEEEEIEEEEILVEEDEEMENDTVPVLEDLTNKTKEELEEMAAADPKIKLVLQYYFVVNTFQEMPDGTRKERITKYKIKKITEKEDTEAGEEMERFQLDFQVDGGNHIFMYLLEDRTVSYFELENAIYYVRGH